MRIAVISDIHSNLPALDAILASFGTVDALWQLGDVVGYGPHPDEVVDRLRERGAIGVRGNHDAAALGGLAVAWFTPDARQAIEWTARRIGPETRAWLGGLPDRLVVGNVTLVHGSPRDPVWEYVTGVSVARASLGAFATPFLLHGHTHVPVVFREDGRRLETLGPVAGSTLLLDDRRLLVNPGSVGQPRDGDPRASALVYDTEARSMTWLRVPYPVGETQAAMRAAGLPPRLVSRLDHGL